MRLYKAALLLLSLGQFALGATDFYKVLGLQRDATDKQIKSAYRQLSKKFHPDKNPNDPSAKDKFVEVAEAYEALIDGDSRQFYDRHGHAAYKERQQKGGGQAQHHDPFDLFSRFFGGGGHFNTQEQRGPNIELKVGIALRDFYNGATSEFHWDKQHICEECSGSGSADGVVEECPHCGGHGIRIIKRQLAPGMFQQLQTPCDACGQRGKIIKHKCETCKGQRVVRKPTPVELNIPKGAPAGFRIRYENEADANPDYVAGDMWVTLVEKDPDMENDNPDKADGTFFLRRGDDLFWKEVISLREAWMGDWTRNVTHLDGHVVHLGRKRGVVIQPGHVEMVIGEGMPKYHEDGDDVYHKTEFGNLFVEYSVILPDQMESGMEKDFWSIFEKWRAKKGVDLQKDSGRPVPDGSKPHDEL